MPAETGGEESAVGEEESMNSKGVIDGLKANYPAGLHPSEQQQRDMMRTMKALKYGPVELQKLYDELLRRCEFFPKVADIISCASAIALPLRPKTRERVWNCVEVDGRQYAIDKGFMEWESAEAREERWMKAKDSMYWKDGGREYYQQGFFEATGHLEGTIAGSVIPIPGSGYENVSEANVDEITGNSGLVDSCGVEWQFEESGSIEDL